MISSHRAGQSEDVSISIKETLTPADHNIDASSLPGSLSVAIRRALPGFTLDVAFDTPPGLTVLFGPSGAGKSLTLQAIAGLLPLDSASISLGATVWHASARGFSLPAQRRHVGYVPQSYALFPHLTVEQNIAFGIKERGRESKERVNKLVELMQLGGLERKRSAQLSGGEQQRVALARALAADPSLLLLDEPFSSLDAPVRETLREELRALHERVQVPIVMVTHDAAEARMLADTVVVIQQGHVLQIGSPDVVFRSPCSRAVAALVGMRTCWSGKVVGVDEASSPLHQVAHMLVNGVRDNFILHAHIPANIQVHIGQTLELGIRTDELRVYSGNASKSMNTQEQSVALVPGTVLRDQPKGAFHSVTALLETGQTLEIPMIVREMHDLGIESGSQVVVGIPARAVHVFRPI